MVSLNAAVWQGRSVFVTGHTGFKGGWMSLWLKQLGAELHGYSLEPPTNPNFFTAAGVGSVYASDVRADLADTARLRSAMQAAKPDVVLHLAAQPLVRESYRDPLGTFATNVMGTANLLDAVRHTPSVRSVVVVTTDKVYENREWPHPYREGDHLGGHDPYSSSKAACEIVTSSYRSSFFSGPNAHPARIATARAGNVIGGGDWGNDRLVPDCLRAFAQGDPVHLRFPGAVRPWQHVLEPVSGYLLVAQKLLETNGADFAKAWNFGPDSVGNATVGEVARETARHWGGNARVEFSPSDANPHEAGLLTLDSSLARSQLGWRPSWNLSQALANTVSWHKAWLGGQDMRALSEAQILGYQKAKEA